VRKVSEGTDIKRLQVLCYLTNTTSELFFRQVIGRVSRVRELQDYEGYVYIPADPRLIACARNIENAQVLAVKEDARREAAEMEPREIQTEFSIYTTSHGGSDVVIIGNEQVAAEEAQEIDRIASQTGLSMQKVREVMLCLGRSVPTTTPAVTQEEQTQEERCDKLRNKCNKIAYRLASLMGVEVKDVHGKFPPQKSMSEAQLMDKYKAIINKINKVELP